MKQVDKHFRDRLRDHESDVPTDMWSRIAPAVQTESRRVVPFFWLLSGAGLLLVSSIAWWATTYSSTESTAMTSATTSHPATIVTENTSTDVLQASLVQDIEANQHELQQEILAEVQTSAAARHISSTDSQPVHTTARDIVDTKSIGLTTTYTTPTTEATSTSGNTQAFKLKITKSYFDKGDRISDNTTVTVDGQARTYEQKVSYITLPIEHAEDQSSTPTDIAPKLSIFGAGAPKCPSFLDKKRVGFYLDGYISHDIAMKSYSGDGEYAALRNQTETGLYSYGAGVRFSYYLGRGVGLRSGLHYQQLNEKFHFDDPDGKGTREVENIETIYDADGNVVDVITTTEIIEVPGRRTVTHGNTYRFVDVPVLFFYEFGKKNSPIYFSVNAGTNINLAFSQSGKYIGQDEEIYSLIQGQEDTNPYKDRIGLSLYTSFGIHYVLTDAMDLVVEPHFSSQLTSATHSTANLQQRFTTVGVNTGVRYKF